MNLVCDSRISGEFKGWDGDTVFILDNGTKWQQARYRYTYRYAYRPRAKIFRDGGRTLLSVEGMNEMLEVRPI
jgi:hypothetical protein